MWNFDPPTTSEWFYKCRSYLSCFGARIYFGSSLMLILHVAVCRFLFCCNVTYILFSWFLRSLPLATAFVTMANVWISLEWLKVDSPVFHYKDAAIMSLCDILMLETLKIQENLLHSVCDMAISTCIVFASPFFLLYQFFFFTSHLLPVMSIC